MSSLKKEWLRLMNMHKVIGDEFPEYIAYQQQIIYNVLEDIHSVGSATELQSAIDQIATSGEAGTIFIEAGTHIIATTIDIDGGGSYVIYGHGDNTVLEAVDGISIFNITNAESVVIELIKLDLNNYTADTQGIIVNEASNKVVIIDNITIDGDGVNGYGIELQSNNCRITNCNITDMNYGINIDGDNNKINGNVVNTNQIGINLTINSDLNYIKENSLTGNTVQWSDNGTNNDIEYRCFSVQDIQDAIDSIAAKSGIIHIISGIITLAATIDVDGGGDYIIEGEGNDTVLTTVGDITCFSISSIKRCELRNFIIDVSSLTTDTTRIIDIPAVSTIGRLILNRLEILGDGDEKGIGLYIDNQASENYFITDNLFKELYQGIVVDGANDITIIYNTIEQLANNPIYFFGFSSQIIISNNYIVTCANNLYLNVMAHCNISHNYIVGCDDNLRLQSVSNSIIQGNIIDGNPTFSGAGDIAGIYIAGGDENIISGNQVHWVKNTGVGDGYGIFLTVGSNDNIVGENSVSDCGIDYLDNGTDTVLFGDDTAYGAGWNGDKGTPTKNAVYDKLKDLDDRLIAHGI